MDNPYTVDALLKATKAILVYAEKEIDFSKLPLDDRGIISFAALLMGPVTELVFDNSSKDDYDEWFDRLKKQTHEGWCLMKKMEG